MKARSGTYALILRSERDFSVRVGKLGEFECPAGFYIYCGSAFGPGGIEARINHHLKNSENPHWHIDYLKTVAPVVQFWYSFDSQKREHQWAEILARLKNSLTPIIGFGASDCSCISHLVYLSKKPSFSNFKKQIKLSHPTHSALYEQVTKNTNLSVRFNTNRK